MAWSSRSGSIGPEDGRRSRSPGEGSSKAGTSNRGSLDATALTYKILTNGTAPRKDAQKGRDKGHNRRASAPDATASAQHYHAVSSGRMAKGWKPALKEQDEGPEGVPAKIVRSSSAELLGKFGAGSNSRSEESNDDLRKAFEKGIDPRWSMAPGTNNGASVRKARSASPLRGPEDVFAQDSKSGNGNGNGNGSVGERASVIPRRPVSIAKKRMTYEEVKNKPLPKIAVI